MCLQVDLTSDFYWICNEKIFHGKSPNRISIEIASVFNSRLQFEGFWSSQRNPNEIRLILISKISNNFEHMETTEWHRFEDSKEWMAAFSANICNCVGYEVSATSLKAIDSAIVACAILRKAKLASGLLSPMNLRLSNQLGYQPKLRERNRFSSVLIKKWFNQKNLPLTMLI